MSNDDNAQNRADLAAGLGTKFDAGKLRYDLLDDDAVEQLVAVLTFGAKKYAPNNWRFMREWRERYYAAMQRHLVAWRKGERIDSDSGMHHLAHAMCCVMFLLAMDLGKGCAPDGAKEGRDE